VEGWYLRSTAAALGFLLLACSAAPAQAPAEIGSTMSGPVTATNFVVAGSTVTRPSSRLLSIVWHHQAHNLSCEAAALKMALAYAGVSLDELTLMSYMGYDLRPARFDPRGRLVTWGDPNSAYVGNPDGHIERYTGYGVYFAPVARAVETAGIHVIVAGSALYGSAVSPNTVYDAVLRGHPVVAWISNTYRTVRLQSYVAYDGSRVSYSLTEHAVTIAGVRPGGVYIDDPWFGPGWHTKAQFEAAFATFGDMAVVVGS
jgi:uncharacterized protein YvpB